MLHVHRAERADGLVEALRGLLAEAPDDPRAVRYAPLAAHLLAGTPRVPV